MPAETDALIQRDVLKQVEWDSCIEETEVDEGIGTLTVEQAILRSEIEDALERRAERHAQHLRVVVHDGTVELYGPVRSWAEREAVLGAVGYTPGVQHVEDHLHLELYPSFPV